ncbi:hypothetical protein P3T76_007725 [Phytophthora citrophthora]|uniref:Uncharacterized protein n=1 Tax=Phytophthora citrophthora TaxID=4793 RepID=A0AAD9LNC9_9STRA|nr:hypothetical protein P3T76_007725 [Phytophthora citrophthora]
MTTSERLLLSLALGTIFAVCSYYCSQLVRRGRPKSLAALQLAAAPRVRLSELQKSNYWVSLCGTVFNVAGDPFFDAKQAGIYSSWVGHDVTYLLLQLGLSPEAADDAQAVASYLEREWPLEALQSDEEDAKRRYELVREWFIRLHSRYEVVAQLSDRYVGFKWDSLREELLPRDSGVNSGGKCPLGFGRKTVSQVASYTVEDMVKLQTITFQGRRYDVMNSSLFQLNGQFAHFIGHDVTYALAVQSTRVEDLDVMPERAYTFEEQLLLERYRNFFAQELVVVEVDEEKKSDKADVVDVHEILQESNKMAQEDLEKALLCATVGQVNAVCARTTMTPLHKAVEQDRLDLVKVLLQAGADIEVRAALYDNETPLEMAHRFHFDDIATLLASASK